MNGFNDSAFRCASAPLLLLSVMLYTLARSCSAYGACSPNSEATMSRFDPIATSASLYLKQI